MPHISSTRYVIAITGALLLGIAGSAGAQDTTRTDTTRADTTRRTVRSGTTVTSQQRIPVRKDAGTTTTESAGAVAQPNADSLAAAQRAGSIAAADRARQDSLASIERMRQDSINAAAAAERARLDSIATAARMRADSIARADSLAEAQARLAGTGLYFQLGGGVSMPRGDFEDGYERGWNATGSVGWNVPLSPFGVRFDVAYDKFNGRSAGLPAGGVAAGDPSALSFLGEAVVRLPMAVVSPYLLAGGGVTRFSDYRTDDETKAQWNVGGGVSFGLAAAKLFVETRYMNVATPDDATAFMPLIVGLRF